MGPLGRLASKAMFPKSVYSELLAGRESRIALLANVFVCAYHVVGIIRFIFNLSTPIYLQIYVWVANVF
jgi:hypothetical protein